MSREQSSLGSAIYYGPQSSDKGLGYAKGTYTEYETLNWDFDFENIPGVSTVDAAVPTIPAGSVIVEARLEVLTVFAGDSINKFDVGLQETDGTEIDNDGLINDAAATSLGWTLGAGSLVGASVGTTDGQVVVSPLTAADAASTPTSGEARLVVKYIRPGSV